MKNRRWTIFPIQYPDLWEWYNKQKLSIWTEEEVDLSNDDWSKLTHNEQFFIKHTLAFFAASDSIVNENLATNFAASVDMYEARMFYELQIAMENIHSTAYSLMIETYIQNHEEKDYLFNAIETIPIVKKKAEWAFNWIENGTFAERLIAFACVEGIFFSSSFASIYYLRELNKLPGLCSFNDFIARDEGLHRDFAVYFYNNYVEKIDKNLIKQIIDSAIELEIEFAVEALPVKLLGINSESMSQYIKYVGNTLKEDLGLEYEVIQNPLKFMEKIAAPKKVNFFEVRPTEYQKINTSEISFNSEF